MIRTSTSTSLSLPTRLILRSCRARSTFACAASDMSPISSMKSVPPLACSNLPLRCLMAEVKAPRSWPNSSLSISSEGMAAQLTSTNGAPARLLLAWSQRATSSLPVPFSPVIRTRASHGATFVDQTPDVLHLLGSAYDLFRVTCRAAFRFGFCRRARRFGCLFECLPDRLHQAVHVDRFGEVVLRSVPECLDSRIDRRFRGKYDERYVALGKPRFMIRNDQIERDTFA